MTRLLAAGLLALALLGGWRQSLLHPLEHVDEHGRFVHLHGADGGDARGENDHDGDPSERLGDLLALLATCAAGVLPVLECAWLEHDAPPRVSPGAPRPGDAPPFLSQGPPASV
jgi:hypothetical protein